MKEAPPVLYEFAMTPDLFDDTTHGSDGSAGIILVELLKGIAENGLLANLHKDRWARHVAEDRVASLPPGLRDKVKSCLRLLHDRHRLVRHPKSNHGEPSSDLDWLRLALDSHQNIPFDGIIVGSKLKGESGKENDALIEFQNALSSERWEEVRGRRSLTVQKSEHGFRTALAPLLRHARSLTLVDAYMNYREARFFDTVTICSQLMGQRGSSTLQGRIHIHAEAKKQDPEGATPKSPQEHLASWEEKLKPLVKRDGHRFKITLWESLRNSQTMYDSFIFTDQCGVFVHRLDCRTRSHPNTTVWNLLDEQVWRDRLQDYDPQMSPFRHVGQREVS